MPSDEIKVFEGINGSVSIHSESQLEDIKQWMQEDQALQRQPYCYQLVGFERSNYRPQHFPFDLWIQFYCRSDALKFKLTFGGKFADIPHEEAPHDDEG
jgi:hypothetical protein